jgi:hypothetical protein
MLERYLDNLTSYAESVCGTFPDSTPMDDELELSGYPYQKPLPQEA